MPHNYQEFNHFLDRLDDFLYDHGWYINGRYIKQNCNSYADVEKYLTEHCYNAEESKRIIKRLQEEIQSILKIQ